MILFASLVLVPLVDQGLKLALRRGLGSRVASMGHLGSLRIVSTRTWIARLGARNGAAVLSVLWVWSAAALVLVSGWFPASSLFVGLLLGGSLSHVIESCVRSSVTDYVCLRFWPAFNLADVAITVGTIGLVGHVLLAVRALA